MIGRYRHIKSLKDEYEFDEVKDRIGSGSFSTVFRAKKATTGTASLAPAIGSGGGFVVLKIIKIASQPPSTEHRMQQREVDREVVALQHLQHSPHHAVATGLPKFVEALISPLEYVIVMEWIPGSLDVNKYLQQHGRLDEDHASLLVAQLLATIHELHVHHRLIHRDVKLENMLLSDVAFYTPAPATSNRNTSAANSSRRSTDATESNKDNAKLTDLLLDCFSTAKGGAIGGIDGTPVSKDSSDYDKKSVEPERAIRRFGRCTLIDFGLARWMTNASPLPHSGGGGRSTSPKSASTILSQQSPVDPSANAPCFPSVTEPTVDLTATTSKLAIQLSCCGSDKYIPYEMLKFHVESASSDAAVVVSSTPHSGGGSVGSRKRLATVEEAMKWDAYAVGVVTHVMLSGCWPFSGRSRAALLKQQESAAQAGGLQLSSTHWTHISHDAKDFVQKLTASDVNRRLSVSEALRHPWITDTARRACERNKVTPSFLSGSQNSRSESPSRLSNYHASQTEFPVLSKAGATCLIGSAACSASQVTKPAMAPKSGSSEEKCGDHTLSLEPTLGGSKSR